MGACCRVTTKTQNEITSNMGLAGNPDHVEAELSVASSSKLRES